MDESILKLFDKIAVLPRADIFFISQNPEGNFIYKQGSI